MKIHRSRLSWVALLGAAASLSLASAKQGAEDASPEGAAQCLAADVAQDGKVAQVEFAEVFPSRTKMAAVVRNFDPLDRNDDNGLMRGVRGVVGCICK